MLLGTRYTVALWIQFKMRSEIPLVNNHSIFFIIIFLHYEMRTSSFKKIQQKQLISVSHLLWKQIPTNGETTMGWFS